MIVKEEELIVQSVNADRNDAGQRQKGVTAHFASEQLLPFVFARHHK